MTKRAAITWLAMGLACVASVANTAEACSCSEVSRRDSFRGSDVVAEVLLLRVEPAASSDGFDQMLLYRFVRVYKGPQALQEGDERWVRYSHCNTMNFHGGHTGARRVLYLRWEPVMVEHYCQMSHSADSVTGYMRRARRARLP